MEWTPRRESDNLIGVKDLTATEVARNLSEVLDAVEHRGETFIVRRKGKAIARISPAVGATGGDAKALLRSTRADADWAEELAELRRGLVIEERRWNG